MFQFRIFPLTCISLVILPGWDVSSFDDADATTQNRARRKTNKQKEMHNRINIKKHDTTIIEWAPHLRRVPTRAVFQRAKSSPWHDRSSRRQSRRRQTLRSTRRTERRADSTHRRRHRSKRYATWNIRVQNKELWRGNKKKQRTQYLTDRER